MSKTRPSPPKADQPIFRTLVFFIICTSIASLLSFPSISQAGLFSKEKTPEGIAKKYGEAVVLITTSDKDGKALGGGSGFIVDPKGIVVTNYHCISGAYTAWVRLTNGAHYEVEGVLGIDKDWDIAVLKIKAKNLPSAPLGDSDKLSVGERVVAIGNPMGLENTVSEGIISAIRSLKGNGDTVIQFTAPISPGSSGGPLFNAKGQVVGVTTLFLKEGQNLNFAVPINRVKPLLQDKEPIPIAKGGRQPAIEEVLPSTIHYNPRISQLEEAIRLEA